MRQIEVRVAASAPLFIMAEASTFGQVFAAMNSEEQAAVLVAIADHMKPHPTQWDHIAIEMEKEANVYARSMWQSMLFPEGGDA